MGRNFGFWKSTRSLSQVRGVPVVELMVCAGLVAATTLQQPPPAATPPPQLEQLGRGVVAVRQKLNNLSNNETRSVASLQGSTYNHPMKNLIPLLALLCALVSFVKPAKTTLYLIGDSTVRNTNAPQAGWGSLLSSYFDTTRISVFNNAMAGRSTRTFVSEGRWDKVHTALKPGDFLIMQFGHNEGSAPDTTKAGRRGVLRGTGEETKDLVWPDGRQETVHTYGWYLRKFIREAKAKGATPLVASMIPRNEWQDGKVKRAGNDFGKWAAEVAQQEGAYFIDLNSLTASKYDKLGPDEVKKLFPGDHTHTNEAGARLNAESVVEGIRANKKIALNKFLAKK